MTLSAISHYRGGAIEECATLAQTLKAIYLRHGVGYRLSRFQTGPNEGDWLVIATYADAAAYAKAQALFPQDPELQRVFIGTAKFAKSGSLRLLSPFASCGRPAKLKNCAPAKPQTRATAVRSNRSVRRKCLRVR